MADHLCTLNRSLSPGLILIGETVLPCLLQNAAMRASMYNGAPNTGSSVLTFADIQNEKPLSDTLEDARAMADVARNSNTVVCIGFTFRRAAGAAALRGLVNSGALGRILHANGRYWCDYARDPMEP